MLVAFLSFCAFGLVKLSDQEKELGNKEFKAGNYNEAINHYTKSIEYN